MSQWLQGKESFYSVGLSPCLFDEWSETQVEAAALWFVGFSMYLYIHNSNLFSLLNQFDFLYLLFQGLLQTFCLLLFEIALSFFQEKVNISPESAVSDSVSSMLAPKACKV